MCRGLGSAFSLLCGGTVRLSFDPLSVSKESRSNNAVCTLPRCSATLSRYALIAARASALSGVNSWFPARFAPIDCGPWIPASGLGVDCAARAEGVRPGVGRSLSSGNEGSSSGFVVQTGSASTLDRSVASASMSRIAASSDIRSLAISDSEGGGVRLESSLTTQLRTKI